MQKIFGLLVVLGCVFGGYFEAGGQLIAIWQPAEIIIIMGAGLGAMIIGNPMHVLKEIVRQIKGVISKKKMGPEFQRQLLMCLYELLKWCKTAVCVCWISISNSRKRVPFSRNTRWC